MNRVVSAHSLCLRYLQTRTANHKALKRLTSFPKEFLQLITDSRRFVQTHTRTAVSRGELDTRVFRRALNLGQGLDRPSDRAIAAFHAPHGGDVDIGPLWASSRVDQRRSARHANLVRGQHATKSINLLQRCSKIPDYCCKKMKTSLIRYTPKISLYWGNVC